MWFFFPNKNESCWKKPAPPWSCNAFNELLPIYVACPILIAVVIALFCPSCSKEVKQRVTLGQVAKYYTPQQLAKELLNNPKFRFSETDEEREKVCKYLREQVAKRSVLSVALNPMDVGGADVHIWDGGKSTVVARDKNWLNASKELKETLSLIHTDRSVQASNFMAKLTDCTGGPCKHYVLGEVTANFSQHNFVVAAHGNTTADASEISGVRQLVGPGSLSHGLQAYIISSCQVLMAGFLNHRPVVRD